MTEYRDPKTGKRTAVLRPENPALSLKRLAEWNTLMDRAESLEALHEHLGPEQEPADLIPQHEAAMMQIDAKWLELKREQGWRFVGWLLDDAKQTSGGPAAPGDLQIGELEFERDWKR